MADNDNLTPHLTLIVFCPACCRESTYVQTKDNIQEIVCILCGQKLKAKILTQYVCEVTKYF